LEKLQSQYSHFRLVRHKRPAFVVSPRLRLRIGGFRFVRRRPGSGLWGAVTLRRRRDDEHGRINELAAGGKRRADGEEHEPCGKSNGVGLHGRVPCPLCDGARCTDARVGGNDPSRTQFPPSRRPLRASTFFPNLRTSLRDRSPLDPSARQRSFLAYQGRKRKFPNHCGETRRDGSRLLEMHVRHVDADFSATRAEENERRPRCLASSPIQATCCPLRPSPLRPYSCR
jgi:hypothetical protein